MRLRVRRVSARGAPSAANVVSLTVVNKVSVANGVSLTVVNKVSVANGVSLVVANGASLKVSISERGERSELRSLANRVSLTVGNSCFRLMVLECHCSRVLNVIARWF